MMISRIRHDWPEKPGFLISRPNGHQQYTFLHFLTPIRIYINEQWVDAPPGACIIYTPGTPQFFCSDKEVVHNWMHSDETLSYLLERFDIPVNCLLYPEQTQYISEIFLRIETEYFSDYLYKELLIDSYVTEFVIRFSRSIHGSVQHGYVSRLDAEMLQNLRKEVLSKPEEKWTIAKMAQLVSLSPSRFHAVYKAVFGTSPMNDVIEARIRYGISLLLSDENLTLPQIAERLGYNDQYHFIRQFKKIIGQTPGQFRKCNR